jgi:phage-related protein
MREIIFYKSSSGQSPVKDFIRALLSKEREKILWGLTLVRDIPIVPQEYFKKLQNAYGIWEIRAQQGNNAFRLLGFMDGGKLVILTNAFSKKTRKTPLQEIALAEQRKKEYQEGKKHG